MKRYISILLTGLIALQPLATLAAEPNSSDVLLTTTPQAFSAIVPTKLPVNMGVDGLVTTAEDTVITNTSKGPIIVYDIAVEIKDVNWSMAHYTADFGKLKVNSKVIGLQFNGDNITSSGTAELNPSHWPAINGLESMNLNYKAKLAAQNSKLTDVEPVTVVFTLKWDEAGRVTEAPETKMQVGRKQSMSLGLSDVAIDETVTWSSSNEAVATVVEHINPETPTTRDCEVTAVGVGTAIITGERKDGIKSSITVIVEAETPAT